MGFVLTLIFISVSLLSPDSLPEALQGIHILEIIAALIIASSLHSASESRVFLLKQTYMITGLLAAVFLSILGTGWVGGAVYGLTGFLPVIAAYYFVTINCSSLTRLKVLAFVLFLVMADVVVHGIIEEQSGALLTPYLFHEREIVRYRGLGVISDPNDFAQVLVTTISLLFLRWKKGAYTANIFLTLLPAAFLVVGVYLTHSRGGLLALVAMTLYGLKNRLGVIRSVILTGALCGALLVFNATGGRNMNDDDGDRIGLWSAALTTFKTHPLIGVGMNNFGDYSGSGLTAHNSYVLCLAELGIFGYVLWMGSIVTSWSSMAVISEASEAPAVEPVDATPRPRFSESQPKAPPEIPAASMRRQIQPPQLQPLQRPLPHLETAPDEPTDIASFVKASHVIRTAMVGLLVAGFFISRTYAITLYVVLGMAAALQVLHQKATKDARQVPILKRIGAVTFASILFLYLFVRFKGSH